MYSKVRLLTCMQTKTYSYRLKFTGRTLTHVICLKIIKIQQIYKTKLALKLPTHISLHKSNFFGGMPCLPDLVVRDLDKVLVGACRMTLNSAVLLVIPGVALVDSRNISYHGFSSLGWSSRTSLAVTLALWVENLRCSRLRHNWRFSTFTTYDLGASWCPTIVPGIHFLSPFCCMMRTVRYNGSRSLFLTLI